jgi:spectinomycin phosphotransferase
MLTPPPDVDPAVLKTLLADGYGALEAELAFQPVGEDSWNYRYGALWVSLRRDLRGHVPAAYKAATEMRAAGLDFVLAPLPARDGSITLRLGSYPVIVFPYREFARIDGLAMNTETCAEVMEKLARVHRCRVRDLPIEDFALPFEADIIAAIAGILWHWRARGGCRHHHADLSGWSDAGPRADAQGRHALR